MQCCTRASERPFGVPQRCKYFSKVHSMSMHLTPRLFSCGPMSSTMFSRVLPLVVAGMASMSLTTQPTTHQLLAIMDSCTWTMSYLFIVDVRVDVRGLMCARHESARRQVAWDNQLSHSLLRQHFDHGATPDLPTTEQARSIFGASGCSGLAK